MPAPNTVLDNGEFALYVRNPAVALVTDPNAWVVVNDLNRFSKRSTRNQQSFPVFKRATAYNIPGAREITYTASGFINPADPGQDILRDAEETDSIVTIRVLYDDVNGWTHPVRVGTTGYDTNADGGLQEGSFEFGSAGDPAIVASGPIL